MHKNDNDPNNNIEDYAFSITNATILFILSLKHHFKHIHDQKME